MATHAQHEDPTPSSLPDVVPFDLQHLTRQSWKLGSRVVADADRVAEWCHTGGGWRLTAFDATDETLVLRIQTPVGRGRFYGAIRTEFREEMPALTASTEWETVDG